MAERAGFEPAVPCGTQHFQCCTIGHSVTSPVANKPYFNVFASLLRQRSKFEYGRITLAKSQTFD